MCFEDDPSLYKVNSAIYRNSLLPEFHICLETLSFIPQKNLYPNSSLEVNWKARYVSYLGVIATSRTWIGFIQVLTTADGIAGITLTVGVLFVI